MFLSDVVNAGAIPSLELSVRYGGERQRLIAHNIANLNTPNFQPVDVPPQRFQAMLREAIDNRDATGGVLEWSEGEGFRKDELGQMKLEPMPERDGILFHDRTRRDIERLMQDHAENLLAFRTTTELLRSRLQSVREAISERV